MGVGKSKEGKMFDEDGEPTSEWQEEVTDFKPLMTEIIANFAVRESSLKQVL